MAPGQPSSLAPPVLLGSGQQDSGPSLSSLATAVITSGLGNAA